MSMFKGLKSKLAEETKRLQVAVSQQVNELNESLASGSSRRKDSERSSVGPEKLGSDAGNGIVEVQEENKTSTPLVASDSPALIDISLDGPPQSESNVPVPPSSSSLMQESDELEVPQRRDSVSSLGSLDSANILPRFVSSFGGHQLHPIPSDLESTTDMESSAGSSFLSGASKEQISTVLHKLQGRASTYKEKYRELGKAYNDLLRENEKCKSVLMTTQDKALHRIQQLREEKQLMSESKKDLESSLRSKLTAQDRIIAALRDQIEMVKNGEDVNEELLASAKPLGAEAAELVAEKEKVRRLEELLGRCKESIKSNKEKMQSLTAEKDELKEQLKAAASEEGSAGISDLVTERVVAEWRMKLELAEKEWARKLTESDERSAMAVAQAKQDVHEEMERKDANVQQLLFKIRTLESDGSTEILHLQDELAEARETEEALEAEKKDLIDQLSKSKQEAVRLVKEEEQKHRETMVVEFREQLAAHDRKWEEKLKELEEQQDQLLKEKEEEFHSQLKQQEEQMQLAIEEREMQKVAALTEQDKRNDQLFCQLELLNTQKLQLETALENQREENESKIKDLVLSIEQNSKRHKEELVLLEKKRDQEQEIIHQAASFGSESLEKQLFEAQEVIAKMTEAVSVAETELDNLKKEFEAARTEFQVTLSEKQESEDNLVTQLMDLRTEHDSVHETLDLISTEKETLINNVANLEHTLADREKKITEFRAEINKLELVKNELLKTFEEKEAYVKGLEIETERRTMEASEANTMCQEQCTVIEQLKAQLLEVETTLAEKLDTVTEEKNAELKDFQQQLERVKQAEMEQVLVEKEQLFYQKESSVKNELQQKNDQLLHAQEALRMRDADLTQLTSAKTTVEQELDDVRQQLAASERKNEFAVKEKELQIKELADLLWTLEEAVGVYRGQMQKHAKEKEVIQQKSAFEVSEQKYQMKEMNGRIVELEEAIEIYRRNCSLKSGQVAELSTEVSVKDVQMSTLQEKLSRVLRESFFAVSEKNLIQAETQDRLRIVEEAVEMYKQQIIQKNQELKTVTEQLKAFQDGSQDTEAKVVEALQKLADSEMEKNHLRRDLEVLKQEKAQQESERANSEERVTLLSCELETQRTSTLHENRKKEEEILRLREEIAVLEGKIDEKTEEAENCARKVMKAEEELCEVKTEISTLMDQNSASSNQEIEALKSLLAQNDEKLLERNAASEKLKEKSLNKLKDMRVENEHLNKSLQQQISLMDLNKQELSEKSAAITALEQQNQLLEKDAEQLKNELSDLQKSYQLIFSELSVKNEHATTMEEEVRTLTDKLESTAAELEHLKTEQKGTHSQLAELQEAVESAKMSETAAVKKMDAILKDKEVHISQLLQRLETDAAEKAAFAESADAELQKVQDKLSFSVEAEKEVKAELEQERTKAMGKTSELEIKISELELVKSEAEGLKVQLKELREHSEKNRTALQEQTELKISDYKKKAEVKLAQIKKQLEKDKDSSVSNIQASLTQLEVALSQKENQVEEFAKKCQDLEEELAEASTSAERNQTELEKARELKEELVENRRKVLELEAAAAEADQLRGQLQTLVNESSEQQLSIEQLETSRSSFSEELQQLKEMFTQKEVELQIKSDTELDMRNELESSQAKIAELEAASQEFERRNAQECERIHSACKQLEDELQVKVQVGVEKDKEIQCLQDSISDLDRKLEEFKESLSEKESSVHTLEMELVSAKQEKDSANSELESVNVEKADYETKIAEIVSEHNEKVKTLAKEFEAQLQRKESEWREEIASSYDRAESDKQRLMKEYQKEMKQLYKDLNERSQALDELQSQQEQKQKNAEEAIQSLKKEHARQLEELVKQSESKAIHEEGFARKEMQPLLARSAITDESDQISELQGKIALLESEIESMKENHRKELDILVRSAMEQEQDSSSVSDRRPPTGTGHDHGRKHLQSISLESFPTSPLFSEPTEAEYLRNVLYRYMTERETMGKESVTLARVIATVLKFTASQTEKVVSKEEARQHTWRLGS